jgi:hypothetical protein
MPTLTIGTRRFHADDWRVTRAAEKMFPLSEEQRRYRIERAKTRIVRSIDAGRQDEVVEDAAAALISQGITEL